MVLYYNFEISNEENVELYDFLGIDEFVFTNKYNNNILRIQTTTEDVSFDEGKYSARCRECLFQLEDEDGNVISINDEAERILKYNFEDFYITSVAADVFDEEISDTVKLNNLILKIKDQDFEKILKIDDNLIEL